MRAIILLSTGLLAASLFGPSPLFTATKVAVNKHEKRWTTAGTEGSGEVLLRPHRRRTPDGGEIGNWTKVAACISLDISITPLFKINSIFCQFLCANYTEMSTVCF